MSSGSGLGVRVHQAWRVVRGSGFQVYGLGFGKLSIGFRA